MKKIKSVKECVVKDCANRSDQVTFVGDLCLPCHRFITTWSEDFSQAYRNSLRLGMVVAMRTATSAIRKVFEGHDPTRVE